VKRNPDLSGGLKVMNCQNSALSPMDIETYICNKLKEIFWEFPKEIVPSTTFKELQQYHDPYFVDAGLLIYIEEDLGVYLPDEDALALDEKNANVGALIDAVVKHRPTVPQEVKQPQPSKTEGVEMELAAGHSPYGV
jgi:hypothetical protein